MAAFGNLPPLNGWDLSTASYDNKTFSVASEDTSPTDLYFRSNGLRMFLLGNSGNDITQYTLLTAWDITTSSADAVTFSVSTEDTVPEGIIIKPDGSKMYILGNFSSTVYQYTLGTPWDLSTASYDTVSFNASAQGTDLAGFTIKPDGTKMYIINGALDDTVYQYTLNTPWDMSTASFDSKSFGLSTQTTGPEDIAFRTDGTRMFIIAKTNPIPNSILQYSLGTAWDVSTASYDSVSFSIASEDTEPEGFVFRNDGIKMYIIGNISDSIYQYTLS